MSSFDYLTNDPGLHLACDDGYLIHPARWQGSHALFILSTPIRSLWLLSRRHSQSCPSEERGVLIGDITLYAVRGAHRLTSHLTFPESMGWASSEGDDARWTEGRAHLELENVLGKETGMLSVEVCSKGPYHLEQESPPLSCSPNVELSLPHIQ